MSVTKTGQRKTVTFTFGDDPDNPVEGNKVTILALNPATEEEVEEKKTVPNTGASGVAFPADYVGECFIEVVGSAGGIDNGHIEVE